MSHKLLLGWKIKKLGEVVEFEGGSQPPKSNFIYTQKNNYIRFLQIRDFDSDKNITFIPESQKNRLCNEADILVGRYGASVGKILVGKKGAYNVAIMKTIPDTTIISRRYFFYYLISDEFQVRLQKVSARSAQAGFSKDDIHNFPLLTPPLPEQKRIVSILDEAFFAISKAKENAEKNLKNAREIFESYLQSIFRSHNDGWHHNKLQELTTKIGSGATPRGGEESYKLTGVSLIRSLNVHDAGFKYKKLAFIDAVQANELKNVNVQSGDILLNITGASVARCCIVPDDILPARVNQHVSIIRVISDLIHPYFLYYLLISNPYKTQLLKTGEESGATRQAITKAQIQNFKISYPTTIKDQKMIISKIDKMRAQIQKLNLIYQKKISAFDELKKSILQKAFSGELTQPIYSKIHQEVFKEASL